MDYKKEKDYYLVKSSKGDKEYKVSLDLDFCECPSRENPCKHIRYIKEDQMTENKTKDLTKEVKSQKSMSINELIESQAAELSKVLPNELDPKRLCRIALTCIKTTPALANCTTVSLLGSLFMSAELGLEPVAGLCYLIPFKNKGVPEVQFVVGYKGLVSLFYRHDSAVSIDAHTVMKNDEFDYGYGSNSFIKHRPADAERGKPIGYYVIATLKNGGKLFKYMSYSEVLAHGKKHSKSFDSYSSPWKKEFDAMGKKTVLIQLSKMLPLSIQQRQAISADETSRDYRAGMKSAMESPDKTDWTDKAKATAETTDTKPVDKKPADQDGTLNRSELEKMQVALINKMNNENNTTKKAVLKSQIDEIEQKLAKLV